MFSLSEPTHHAKSVPINHNPKGKVSNEAKHRLFRITKQPLDEKTPYRKQLRYQEASSAMIKTKLDDSLGRIPWSNNHKNIASYVDGTGGLSQQKLLAIMSQLTNDIRVNGRRITPLQTQIVQQTTNGEINPTSPMSNMQDEMQPDMQNSMQDDMQSNNNDMGDNEIKPIQIPMNQKGGNGAHTNGPGMFERLMFGGLSQTMGGGGKGNNGYSEFGGEMTNVPGLSYGGSNSNGVINLMESEHGLKPMRGMNGMGRMNGMMTGNHGMMNGMHGMNGMMNGMGMMMHGMGRMRGSTFFSRRGETTSVKKKARSKPKAFLQKVEKAASFSDTEGRKNPHRVPTVRIRVGPNSHKSKQDIIPFIPSDGPSEHSAHLTSKLYVKDVQKNVHG